MKTKLTLLLSVVLYLLYSFTLSAKDDPKTWKYFRIDADINSNSLFADIQNDLGIKEPEAKFKLIVNISDSIPQNQYIEFVHKSTGAKKRYSWYELSGQSQLSLLGLTGPEKFKLGATEDAADKYFRIYANIKDSSLFIDIQKELLKNEELLETYTITVNVSDPVSANNYVVFGSEDVKDPVKFAWNDLSARSREALLNWKKREVIEQ